MAYEAVNALCGDRIRMELNVSADQTITAVRFRGDGLAVVGRAAASILTELNQGQMLQEVVASFLKKRYSQHCTRPFGQPG